MRIPSFLQLLVCGCPASTALETIPDETCLENFGQVVKIILQRTKNGSTIQTITIGTGAGETDLLVTWTALKAAVDSTKIVVSPELGGIQFEPGEANVVGGGNETPYGKTVVLRKEPTKVEGNVLRSKQNVIKSMKKIGCEDGNISIFLVNDAGQLAGYTDDNASPTTIKGFPINAFVVSDKKIGGREELDSNKVMFELVEDWSDNFHVITPTSFNFATDI